MPDAINRHLLRCGKALIALPLFALAFAFANGQEPYRVVDHWKIGGTGGWDYLLADSAAHLLYITHGPRVEVIDSGTGKAVAVISGMKGTHGIVFEPTTKRSEPSTAAART